MGQCVQLVIDRVATTAAFVSDVIEPARRHRYALGDTGNPVRISSARFETILGYIVNFRFSVFKSLRLNISTS